MFRLAETLGYASPSRMLEEMTDEDLAGWIAWEQVAGPIGKARTDILFGHLLSFLAVVHGGRGARSIAPSSLIPFYAPWSTVRSEGAATSPDALAAMFRSRIQDWEQKERLMRTETP